MIKKESIPPLWTRNFVFACLSNIMMGLSFYQIIPVLPIYLTDVIQAPTALLGLIMSIYVLAAICSRPMVAHWVDTGNRKNIYLLVYLLFALSFAGYVVATTTALLLIVRIVQGLIWGGMTTAGPTLASDIIPNERRGEGLGFFGMTMTLGMCLGPVVGLNVFKMYSFEALVWSSLLLGLVGLGFATCIRSKHLPKHEPVESSPKGVLDRLVMRVGIPLAINVIMASFSYGVVSVYSAMYGEMYHFKYAGMFYALMGLGMLVSRFIAGKQIDRGRVAELSVISLGILSISFALLALVPTAPVYYGSAVFIGAGFGIFIPTFQTMKLNMASRGHRGAMNSTFFTAFDIGVGSGMFFGGKIYALLGLNWSFGIAAICNILAIVYFYRVSLDHYRKNKLGVDS